MERQKIETQYKWTIDEMYPSELDLNKDIDKVKELIDKLASYKGKLAESKSNLYEALHTSEDAGRILEKLYVYTHMKSHEDTRINDNQGKATKIDMLSTELSMATSYMVPEIISMDEAKLNEYLQDEKLSFYKKYVDEILRVKPHTLSEREEEILAAASDLTAIPENVYDMMSYADMQFPEIEDEEGKKVKLTHANFSLFLKSKDRRVRKDAFEDPFELFFLTLLKFLLVLLFPSCYTPPILVFNCSIPQYSSSETLFTSLYYFSDLDKFFRSKSKKTCS